MEVIAQLGGKPTPMTGDLWMTVDLYPPTRRVYDLDNHASKSLCDSLTHAGVWEDDKQLVDLHARMHKQQVVSGGLCVVSIGQMLEEHEHG